MTNPPGYGMARWWPLAKLAGWRDSWRSWFLAIGTRESHGQRTVEDYAHSRHIGFFQLAWEWYSGIWSIAGNGRHFDPRNAYWHLYWTWRIVMQEGTGPWAL